MVIKGYTNTIELNSIYEYYPAVAVLTYLKYELHWKAGFEGALMHPVHVDPQHE